MTPDASGNFKGMSVPADAWERVFGQGELFDRQPDFEELCPVRNVRSVDHECSCGHALTPNELQPRDPWCPAHGVGDEAR